MKVLASNPSLEGSATGVCLEAEPHDARYRRYVLNQNCADNYAAY